MNMEWKCIRNHSEAPITGIKQFIRVLVTRKFDDGYKEVAIGYYDSNTCSFVCEGDEYHKYFHDGRKWKVTAWMPLPEQYKDFDRGEGNV